MPKYKKRSIMSIEIDEVEIDNIIKKYRLDNTVVVRNRIKLIKKISSLYKLEENIFLYDNELLNRCFPTGNSEMVGLIGWYKKDGNDIELAKKLDSLQMAGPARNLRDNFGFIFKVNPNGKDIHSKDRYCFNKKGIQYRQIIGVNPDFCEKIISSSDKLSKKIKNIYLKDKKDPITDDSSGLEIDHRQPKQACLKLGLPIICATDKDVKEGNIDKHFQALTSSTNLNKSRSCERCLKGGKIEIPSGLRHLQNIGVFKSQWHEDTKFNKSCLTCFWYNVDRCGEFIDLRYRKNNNINENDIDILKKNIYNMPEEDDIFQKES
jgi:hypothetical protein